MLKRLKVHNFKYVSNFILIVLSLLAIAPILLAISISFKTSQEIYAGDFSLLPSKLDFINYKIAIERIDFLRASLNTLYITVINIVTVVIGSSLAAYAFCFIKFKYREALFVLTLGIMMLPDMAIAIPQFLIFKSFNLIDGFLPLLLPYFGGLPFYIFLYKQFFIQIPHELVEAAKVDGADSFYIYHSVIMPLVKPVTAIVCILQFLISWNDLIKPSIFITNEEHYTLALSIQQYQSKLGGIEWGPLMASIIMMMIPSLIVFIIGQKYIIQGVARTGLKE